MAHICCTFANMMLTKTEHIVDANVVLEDDTLWLSKKYYRTETPNVRNSLLYKFLYKSLFCSEPDVVSPILYLPVNHMYLLKTTIFELFTDDVSLPNSKFFTYKTVYGSYGTNTGSVLRKRSLIDIICDAWQECQSNVTPMRPVIYYVCPPTLFPDKTDNDGLRHNPVAAIVLEYNKVSVYIGKGNIVMALDRAEYLTKHAKTNTEITKGFES